MLRSGADGESERIGAAWGLYSCYAEGLKEGMKMARWYELLMGSGVA